MGSLLSDPKAHADYLDDQADKAERDAKAAGVAGKPSEEVRLMDVSKRASQAATLTRQQAKNAGK